MPRQTSTTDHTHVTSKQLTILILLHRFRFGTTDLLARALDLRDGRYSYTRLEALVSQGYIGKHYGTTYKRAGKPATYYLLPKAFKPIKQQTTPDDEPIAPKSLRNAYKDKEASEAFILAVFTIYDKLRASYGDRLNYWTKDELNTAEYDFFPKPKPDAYITFIPEGPKPHPRRFMLHYLDDTTPFFVHVRRLRVYVDYIEENEWETKAKAKLRGILLVCESTSLLRRTRKKLATMLNEYDTPRLHYTTIQAIQNSTPKDDEVWQAIGEPLRLFSLENI